MDVAEGEGNRDEDTDGSDTEHSAGEDDAIETEDGEYVYEINEDEETND